MNAVMNLAAIVAMMAALAAAGSAARPQGDAPSPSKLAANHNETLVSDSAPDRLADAEASQSAGWRVTPMK